jgi:hypothetical protein
MCLFLGVLHTHTHTHTHTMTGVNSFLFVIGIFSCLFQEAQLSTKVMKQKTIY